MPGMDAYPLFLRAMKDFELPPGARIRLAVSGGPDSMALAGLFVQFAQRHRPDLEISLGHIHHRLRGAEADTDEELCQRFASVHGLPFQTRHVDTPGVARTRHLSIETAARELRLETFRQWAREANLHAVVTGHHLGDQVETVLGNLIRGTGVRGLRAMRAVRPLLEETEHAGKRSTLLWRPLLRIRPEALARFRERYGIEARADSMNRDLAYRRNRIRTLLLPQLERVFNPSVERALLGLADDAAELEADLERRLGSIRDASRSGPGVVAVPRSVVQGREVLMGPALDHLWCQATGRRSGLTRDHHEAWRRIVAADRPGHHYDLPHGWWLERAAGWLFLLRDEDRSEPHPVAATGPEVVVDWAGLTLEISSEPSPGSAALLSPAWLTVALLRPVGPADRLRTAAGRLQVTELLRAAGVPPPFRTRYPVWVSQGEVVWVPGLRSGLPPDDRAPRFGSVRWHPGRSQEAFIYATVVGGV